MDWLWKAYDVVWHGSMIEAVKMVGIADNIESLFENSKETWRTEVAVCNESLGEVDIRRDFSGGFFFTFDFYSYTFINLEWGRPRICNKSKSEIETTLVYGRFKDVCKVQERIGFANPDRENFF